MANQFLGTVMWKAIEADEQAWVSLLLAISAALSSKRLSSTWPCGLS